MTQEELAEAVGTTGPVISLLEAGERGLSAKWLHRLAPVLGTRAGILLDHHPEDLDTDFIKSFTEADPRLKRQIVKIVATMIETAEDVSDAA